MEWIRQFRNNRIRFRVVKITKPDFTDPEYRIDRLNYIFIFIPTYWDKNWRSRNKDGSYMDYKYPNYRNQKEAEEQCSYFKRDEVGPSNKGTKYKPIYVC